MALLGKEFVSPRSLLLTLDASGLGDIFPGDHVAIFPRNSREAVAKVVSKLSGVPSAMEEPGYIQRANGDDDSFRCIAPKLTPVILARRDHQSHCDG